jgi:NitT/TauT family transport system ATP-binding protein
MCTFLEVENVGKTYATLSGENVSALKHLSFSIKKGEFLTVVGASGSGKSTLLHILAGIEEATAGSIRWLTHAAPPRIGFVFQANTVFPWRTVERNLTYPLEVRHADAPTRRHRAMELCRLVGLDWDNYHGKYPKELSGGEKRRVAIGMALARQAELLLLDEPTSQMDYVTKWSMQRTILEVAAKEQFTAVLVTHDLDEAILLGDRVMILERGEVREIIEINLPRPRTQSLLVSEEFNHYREQIIKPREPATP